MVVENNKVSFSVRLDEKVCERLDTMRKPEKRSRNAQIEMLLEIALDLVEARNKKLAEVPS